MPPLAIAEYAAAICIGVTDSPWPIGRLPIDEPEYCLPVQDDSLLLAGEVDAGGRAEPEPVHPVVEALWPELHPDLVGADVARDLEDLGDRQRLVAVGLGVVDLAVGDLEHRRDVELGGRGDQRRPGARRRR